MTYEEIRNVIVLEYIAPSEYDKNLIEIPQDIRDNMYERYLRHESMENIFSVLPEGDHKDRMLDLARLIDEKVQTELQEKVQS